MYVWICKLGINKHIKKSTCVRKRMQTLLSHSKLISTSQLPGRILGVILLPPAYVLLGACTIPVQDVRRVDAWLPILRRHDPVAVVDSETVTINDNICCRED